MEIQYTIQSIISNILLARPFPTKSVICPKAIFPAVDTGYTFFRACHAAEVILSHLHTNAF